MKSVPRRDMLRAVRHLKAADPVMADVISRVGPIEMLLRRGRFLTLVRSIIGQQISTSAFDGRGDERFERVGSEVGIHGHGIGGERCRVGIGSGQVRRRIGLCR